MANNCYSSAVVSSFPAAVGCTLSRVRDQYGTSSSPVSTSGHCGCCSASSKSLCPFTTPLYGARRMICSTQPLQATCIGAKEWRFSSKGLLGTQVVLGTNCGGSGSFGLVPWSTGRVLKITSAIPVSRQVSGTEYQFREDGSELEVRVPIPSLEAAGRQLTARYVTVDAQNTSLKVAVQTVHGIKILLNAGILYGSIKPSETEWFVDEAEVVLSLKKADDELSWPKLAETWDTLAKAEHTDLSEIKDKLLGALKNRKTEDAWRFYEVLGRRGVLPSDVCLSRLIAQLSHKGTPSSLSRAQGVVVTLQKIDQVNRLDRDSLGLLVMASARTGAARYALSILRLMLQMEMCPPVKVWSAVVNRLGKHRDDSPLALQLFDEICSFLKLDTTKGSSPSGETGNDSALIESEVKGGSSGQAKRILASSENGGMNPWASGKEVLPDTAAFNAALNACATAGFVDTANNLRERMSRCGVEPDLVTFNILIKLFTKAEESEHLTNLLQEMEEAGIEPDLSTYNSLVSSYVSLGQLDEAERLVQSMQQGLTQSEPLQSAGPNVIARPKSTAELGTTKALEGVERIKLRSRSGAELKDVAKQSDRQIKLPWTCRVRPNVRTYTTLMKGYVKEDRLRDAVQLLIAMQSEDESWSQPNEVTYTTVIAACVDVGLMDEAKAVLSEMASLKVPVNLITYNILLKGYCNASQVSRAYEVLDDMRKAGLSPDVVSYNTLINGCLTRDDNMGAVEVFKEMRKARIVPSDVTYTTLMKAFATNGDTKLVGDIFHEMQMNSWMRVDVIAWNVLIDSYCVAGSMSEAKQSFAKMKEQGFHPTLSTYGSLAKGFAVAGQPGEMLVLWKEIQGRLSTKPGDHVKPIELDGGLLDCLVDTFLRAGFFQRALEVVACMEEQGILADKTKFKRMFIDLYTTLYTGKHTSPARLAKSADRRSAVDAFKFWLGLPNERYQSDWTP